MLNCAGGGETDRLRASAMAMRAIAPVILEPPDGAYFIKESESNWLVRTIMGWLLLAGSAVKFVNDDQTILEMIRRLGKSILSFLFTRKRPNRITSTHSQTIRRILDSTHQGIWLSCIDWSIGRGGGVRD